MTHDTVSKGDFHDPEVPGHSDSTPLLASAEQRWATMVDNFDDPSQEWRRLCAEAFGTFFLVLVAAGGPMIDQAIPGSVGRAAAVVAPGLMVMSIILLMGKVSGAHLNPAVSIAFSLRRDFPWRRVPAYVVAQLAGALLAAWFLQAVIHVSAHYGSNYPGWRVTAVDAFLMEAVLTVGLVSVILGTLGPDIVAADFSSWWVYLAGPLLGAVLAVGMAYLLRGPGGGTSGSLAAQGTIRPLITRPGKA